MTLLLPQLIDTYSKGARRKSVSSASTGEPGCLQMWRINPQVSGQAEYRAEEGVHSPSLLPATTHAGDGSMETNRAGAGGHIWLGAKIALIGLGRVRVDFGVHIAELRLTAQRREQEQVRASLAERR